MKSKKRKRGDKEKKKRSEGRGIYDEGIGCWRVCDACGTAGTGRLPW